MPPATELAALAWDDPGAITNSGTSRSLLSSLDRRLGFLRMPLRAFTADCFTDSSGGWNGFGAVSIGGKVCEVPLLIGLVRWIESDAGASMALGTTGTGVATLLDDVSTVGG